MLIFDTFENLHLTCTTGSPLFRFVNTLLFKNKGTYVMQPPPLDLPVMRLSVCEHHVLQYLLRVCQRRRLVCHYKSVLLVVSSVCVTGMAYVVRPAVLCMYMYIYITLVLAPANLWPFFGNQPSPNLAKKFLAGFVGCQSSYSTFR